MDQVTQIDAPELIRIAVAVREVAAVLGRTADGMRDLESPPGDAVEGSGMCRVSLPEAALGWHGSLTTLAGQVNDFGAGLARSAADYQEADALAAARVRASGHPSGRITPASGHSGGHPSGHSSGHSSGHPGGQG